MVCLYPAILFSYGSRIELLYGSSPETTGQRSVHSWGGVVPPPQHDAQYLEHSKSVGAEHCLPSESAQQFTIETSALAGLCAVATAVATIRIFNMFFISILVIQKNTANGNGGREVRKIIPINDLSGFGDACYIADTSRPD